MTACISECGQNSPLLLDEKDRSSSGKPRNNRLEDTVGMQDMKESVNLNLLHLLDHAGLLTQTFVWCQDVKEFMVL